MGTTRDLSSDAPTRWLRPSEALNRLVLDESGLHGRPGAAHADAEEGELRHGVKIGSYGLLLPADVVSEVVKDARVYPVPKTASWVKGIINLRGNLMPVFDLAPFIDPHGANAGNPTVLAVDKAENALALIVDGIPRLASTEHPIETESISFPQELRAHLRGAFTENDHTWLELDLPGLLETLAPRMNA